MTSEREAEKPEGRAHHLPELLAEIAEVAGLAAALAVAQVRGGARAHFPASCPDDHWLVAAVGREAADKLCQHFTVNLKGGVTLTVPLGPTKLYERARFRALAMLEAGHSCPETAREIGVSTRSIEYWAAAERKRQAVHRQSRKFRADPSLVILSRPYDRVKDGLVSSLDCAVAERVQPEAAKLGINEPDPPDVDLAKLPRLIAEMAEVAGVVAAVVVGTMKATKVLHVTDHAGRGDELVRLVGPVSGAKLVDHFRSKHAGPVELLMPYHQPAAFAAVAGWAAAAREAGHASADVAAWLGLTPAVVEHLCAAVNATVGSRFNFRRDFPYFDPATEV